LFDPISIQNSKKHSSNHISTESHLFINRVSFWNDTNISFDYQPHGADIQQLTYSSYYGENCAKGGVLLQFAVV
jgi:hypothetical protein